MRDDYFCDPRTIHDIYKGFVLKCHYDIAYDLYIFYTYIDGNIVRIAEKIPFFRIGTQKHIEIFRKFIDNLLSCDNKLEAELVQLVE